MVVRFHRELCDFRLLIDRRFHPGFLIYSIGLLKVFVKILVFLIEFLVVVMLLFLLMGPKLGNGDVIVAANGTTIENKEDLFKLVKALKSGEPVILKFIRSGRTQGEQLETETCYTSIVKP